MELTKYDVFNALTVGVVHTGFDMLGVAGEAQPLNSRAAVKGAMSAASDIVGTFVAVNMGPRLAAAVLEGKEATPAAGSGLTQNKFMAFQAGVSGLAYPLLDKVSKVDSRPFLMQFLVQAGSSVVGGKIYEPIGKWAGLK